MSSPLISLPTELKRVVLKILKGSVDEELSKNEEKTTGTHDLAQVAFTCRELSSVALDLLWERGNLFFALLNVGVPLEWSASTMSYPPNWTVEVDWDKVSFAPSSASNQAPLGVDWDRMLFYSRRIKHLEINGDGSSNSSIPEVSTDVFDVLELFISSEDGERHIFPSLCSLLLAVPHFGGIFQRHLDIFKSPFLRHFSFPVYAADSNEGQAIFHKSMATIAPDLESLKLLPRQHGRIDSRLVQSVSRVIMANDLTKLTRLEISGISQDALARVAYLPCLIDLTAANLHPIFSDYPLQASWTDFVHALHAQGSQAPKPYSNLQRLLLLDYDSRYCSEFLRAIAPCTTLVDVSLRPRESTRQDKNVELYLARQNFMRIRDALMECCGASPQIVQKITINCNESCAGDPSSFQLDMALPRDILAPLLSFPKLQVLDVANQLLELDDNFIKQASQAWPEICTLKLGSENGVHPPSHITLQGLVPLLKHCPELRDLGLVVGSEGPAITAQNPHLHCKLRTLNLANSTAADFREYMPTENISEIEKQLAWARVSAKREQVGAFLASLFDDIEGVVTWTGEVGASARSGPPGVASALFQMLGGGPGPDLNRRLHIGWMEVFASVHKLSKGQFSPSAGSSEAQLEGFSKASRIVPISGVPDLDEYIENQKKAEAFRC